MRLLRTASTCLLLASATTMHAQESPSPSALLAMGIELYDRGDFEGALEQYRAALKVDPKDSRVLYELTLTLVAQGKLDEALPAAERGASAKSPDQPAFLDLYGNLLDGSGRSAQAMRAYERGLKIDEAFAPIHYDYGIAAAKAGKVELALKHFKRNVELRPGHPAGQFSLAGIWDAQGYRTPTLFALMRYLTLDENTPKSREVAKRMVELLNNGLVKKEGNQVTIDIDRNAKTGEGDFRSYETAVSLISVVKVDEDTTESAHMAFVISMAIAMFGDEKELKNIRNTFVYRNYGGFFLEMREKNHLDAFANIALAQIQMPGAAQWVSAHAPEIAAYHQWVASKGIQTPALQMK